MSYLVEAMQHLGIYCTPSNILALGYGDGKTADYIAGNPPFGDADALDDGFAEFECFWPAIDDLPDGVDIFEGVFPVSGEPS